MLYPVCVLQGVVACVLKCVCFIVYCATCTTVVLRIQPLTCGIYKEAFMSHNALLKASRQEARIPLRVAATARGRGEAISTYLRRLAYRSVPTGEHLANAKQTPQYLSGKQLIKCAGFKDCSPAAPHVNSFATLSLRAR